MKEVKVKNWLGRTTATILLYESIKELPILRYQEFEKMLLQDVGIGSTMKDVGTRFGNLYRFIHDGDLDNTHKEAKNLHNTLYFILSGFNIQFLSFIALVHSVNSNEIDISKPDKVRSQLKGLKQGDVEEITDEVKKKLIQNFEPCFLIEALTAHQLTLQQA